MLNSGQGIQSPTSLPLPETVGNAGEGRNRQGREGVCSRGVGLSSGTGAGAGVGARGEKREAWGRVQGFYRDNSPGNQRGQQSVEWWMEEREVEPG